MDRQLLAHRRILDLLPGYRRLGELSNGREVDA